MSVTDRMGPPRVVETKHRTTAPVAPAKLAHVVLNTLSVPKLRDWYISVLECRIVYGDDNVCFLTYDDEHHRIAMGTIPGLQEAAGGLRVGLAHIAFGYRDLGDLLFTYKRLKSKGIEPFWPINHGMTISLYYHDPDGNTVELQVETISNPDDINKFMKSEDFVRNPIGVLFDPDEFVARYEAGVAIEDLARRPELPPGMAPFDMLRT
jgi:catechol-2,3-dioxygenase